MHYIFLFLLLFSCLRAETVSLHTMQNEKRVAFVIGNGAYDESPIDTSVSDAQKMRGFLQKNNFEVVYIEDASKRKLIKGLRDFNSIMQKDSVALFYYSGHAVQIKEKNYLIPTETFIESDYHVLYEAIELDAIIDKMRLSQNRLNIVILDSARDNPFAKRFRTNQKGLSAIKTEKNLDLIFSAPPDKTANPYDFTSKLISALSHKGTSNNEAFSQMQAYFKSPYFTPSDQNFYFDLPDRLIDKDEKLWSETVALGSASAYNTYLSRYPSGKHTVAAKSRLAELKHKAEAAAKEEADKKHAEEAAKKAEEKATAIAAPVQSEISAAIAPALD